MKKRSWWRLFPLAPALIALTACGHTPVTRTLADAFGKGAGAEQLALQANFSYLKVTAHGRDALMVLGYVDSHPMGAVETWFSSQGEVLRLQNGRILSTAGLELNWQAVRYKGLPDWRTIVAKSKLAFTRERDEMPGYRFDLVDRVELYAVPAPKNAHLVGVDPTTLLWFEERVQSALGSLPTARYGLRLEAGEPRVVYGEQCFTDRFCMAWQTWPAK